MTANAFTSVSLEPLLVLVCVETEARFHDAVTRPGQWAVSILDAAARPVADWLASRGRPLPGQLDRVPPPGPGHRRGRAGPGAALAGVPDRGAPGGDHSIVVGEVVGVGLGRDDTRSLLYHRSGYHKLA